MSRFGDKVTITGIADVDDLTISGQDTANNLFIIDTTKVKIITDDPGYTVTDDTGLGLPPE